jgi:hypothetical protein
MSNPLGPKTKAEELLRPAPGVHTTEGTTEPVLSAADDIDLDPKEFKAITRESQIETLQQFEHLARNGKHEDLYEHDAMLIHQAITIGNGFLDRVSRIFSGKPDSEMEIRLAASQAASAMAAMNHSMITISEALFKASGDSHHRVRDQAEVGLEQVKAWAEQVINGSSREGDKHVWGDFAHLKSEHRQTVGEMILLEAVAGLAAIEHRRK